MSRFVVTWVLFGVQVIGSLVTVGAAARKKDEAAAVIVTVLNAAMALGILYVGGVL